MILKDLMNSSHPLEFDDNFNKEDLKNLLGNLNILSLRKLLSNSLNYYEILKLILKYKEDINGNEVYIMLLFSPNVLQTCQMLTTELIDELINTRLKVNAPTFNNLEFKNIQEQEKFVKCILEKANEHNAKLIRELMRLTSNTDVTAKLIIRKFHNSLTAKELQEIISKVTHLTKVFSANSTQLLIKVIESMNDIDKQQEFILFARDSKGLADLIPSQKLKEYFSIITNVSLSNWLTFIPESKIRAIVPEEELSKKIKNACINYNYFLSMADYYNANTTESIRNLFLHFFKDEDEIWKCKHEKTHEDIISSSKYNSKESLKEFIRKEIKKQFRLL